MFDNRSDTEAFFALHGERLLEAFERAAQRLCRQNEPRFWKSPGRARTAMMKDYLAEELEGGFGPFSVEFDKHIDSLKLISPSNEVVPIRTTTSLARAESRTAENQQLTLDIPDEVGPGTACVIGALCWTMPPIGDEGSENGPWRIEFRKLKPGTSLEHPEWEFVYKISPAKIPAGVGEPFEPADEPLQFINIETKDVHRESREPQSKA